MTKIVIIGPTGSGKSSLANVLLGESPLCKDCTFPVCSQGLHSCTKETTMATKPWLGENEMFTVVDTPGFGDSDNDDSDLVDEMMAVLNKEVGSANLILLLIKGTETRLGGELQQMIREMRALFGEKMWNNLVIGVSFWSFKTDLVNYRESTCKWSPDNCRNEEWFETSMKSILHEKFHIKEDLPFVFLDSWAKHPMNVNDEDQKEMFDKESRKLWNLAKQTTPFKFMTVNDVLHENHAIKKRNAELKEIINNEIEDIKKRIDSTDNELNNVSTAYVDIEKIIHDHKDKIGKMFEMINNLNDSSEVAINKIIEDFDSITAKFDKKLKDVQENASRQVTKVEKTSSDILKQMTDLKKESHSVQKSLTNEIQERRNLNKIIRDDVSKNMEAATKIGTKVAIVEKDLSFLNGGQTNLNNEKKSLQISVSGLKSEVSKLKNLVLTTKNCYSSGYVNHFDYPINFRCPGNKVMVRAESYHTNGTEDRRWKFECCDLVIQF